MCDPAPRRAVLLVPLAPLVLAAQQPPTTTSVPERTRDELLPAGSAEPLAPLLGDAVVVVGTDSARIRWSTDGLSTSRVEYGLTPAYGSVVEDPTPVSEHALELEDLQDDATYYFRYSSSNQPGYTATSAGQTLTTAPYVEIEGAPRLWFPVQFRIRGPVAHEMDTAPNPFLDYHVVLRLTAPSGTDHIVHGFFDGDGAGGPQGDVWRVRFAPDESGPWSYTVFFREGPDLAVDLDLASGSTVVPHGEQGSFSVAPLVPSAPGFYRWGRLEYVGGHYLKFRDGPFFLKGGTDSPENLLGYAGFDNTFDQPGGASAGGLAGGLHRFGPHVADYGPGGLGDAGDPLFASADSGVDSRGLVGALNYLSSEGVNSVYFLPMNLGGDGRETYPFVGPGNNAFDKTHYDLSKLEQWESVFAHATRRGIQLQFVLAEAETGNTNWLDGGQLGTERKLFYREMVARFGHHLAIKWNLSEEPTYSVAQLREFADYIAALDPYAHPIAFHTSDLPPDGGFGPYSSILGDPRFSATSIQGDYLEVGGHVDVWRAASANAGRPWVIDIDEPGPAGEGLTDTNADLRRRATLWDVYLNGGNLEWYAGSHALPLGGDISLEDFRTRESMWRFTAHARSLIESYPFHAMDPADGRVTGATADLGGPEVFALAGEVYLIYYPSTDALGVLDLSGTAGGFRARWFDPRAGAFAGPTLDYPGGRSIAVGPPPGGGGAGIDWVLVVDRP